MKSCLATFFFLLLGVGIVGAEEVLGDEISRDTFSFINSRLFEPQKIADNKTIGNFIRAKNVFKINIGSPMGVSYERVIWGRLSVAISPSVVYLFNRVTSSSSPTFGDFFTTTTTEEFSYNFALGAYLIPKVYLSRSKNVPSGWYIGFPFGFGYVRENNTSKISNVLYWGAAIGPGFQWIYISGLAVDMNLALGADFAKVDMSTGSTELFDKFYKLEFLPLISLGIGYAF